jgi:hypothetical protein
VKGRKEEETQPQPGGQPTEWPCLSQGDGHASSWGFMQLLWWQFTVSTGPMSPITRTRWHVWWLPQLKRTWLPIQYVYGVWGPYATTEKKKKRNTLRHNSCVPYTVIWLTYRKVNFPFYYQAERPKLCADMPTDGPKLPCRPWEQATAAPFFQGSPQPPSVPAFLCLSLWSL